MPQTRHLCSAFMTASVLGFAAVSSTSIAQTVGPLLQLTNVSIFTQCNADNVHGQEIVYGAKNYNGTAIEPWLSISPTNPSDLLVGVQQDRWSNGGSRGLRGEYSYDGGVSWKATTTPNVTLCQNGPWDRSSDPWVDFSSDGKVAYFSALVEKESRNPNALAGVSGQTVSSSLDGGATWGPPFTLILDNNINILNDKNSVTADASNPKAAYVVWDRLQQYVPGAGVADEGQNSGSDSGNAAAAVLGAPMHDGSAVAHALLNYGRKIAAGKASAITFPVYVTGPTLMARTLDGGKSWSLPKVIWDPGPNSQTIANHVVNLPNGYIADFFTELQDNSNGQPARIGNVQSADDGATWSAPVYAQSLVNEQAVTPNLQQDIRSADVLFSVATDATNGVVYLVWEDQRFSGVNEVAFAWSPDNGVTWTQPVRINQTPRVPLNPLFQQALIPSVAVAADGTVGVTYYDFRNDKVGATTDATDYWLVTCNVIQSADNCLSNGDWTSEVRMTNTSFDYDLAPVAIGHFLGDYMGLKAVGTTFYSVFGQSPKKNVTNQFFRTVTLSQALASK